MKPTLLRPRWRKLGPPQLGSSEVTKPAPNPPGSSIIQACAFSGDLGVTHVAGLVVLSALVPESAKYTVREGFTTAESLRGVTNHPPAGKRQPPIWKLAP